MAGRGAQTFKKRQKEQQRKEKAQEKLTKRLERTPTGVPGSGPPIAEPEDFLEGYDLNAPLPGEQVETN